MRSIKIDKFSLNELEELKQKTIKRIEELNRAKEAGIYREVKVSIPHNKPFKMVYQFKITLLGTNPPVWRRIQVPESYTFYDLHVALQDTMGWFDYHLHMFEIGEAKNLVRIQSPFMEPGIDGEEQISSTEVPMKQYLKEQGQSVKYYYDFGDGWEHTLNLEKIISKETKVKYPICLEGALACPPEDCGGVSGYYDCIEAVKNQNNKDELLDWLGGWDPYKFKPEDVKFDNPRKRLEYAMS